MLCQFVFNWLQEKDYLIVNAVEYERETGFYYVSSRYYDPEIGRFINADSYASTGQGILGHNMFAYCNNNPINCIDMTGCYPVTVFPINFGVQGRMLSNNLSSNKNEEKIDQEIQDSYSKQEAIISNSINVNSKYDRLKICLRRTLRTRTGMK